jgi:hypothetical protein
MQGNDHQGCCNEFADMHGKNFLKDAGFDQIA